MYELLNRKTMNEFNEVITNMIMRGAPEQELKGIINHVANIIDAEKALTHYNLLRDCPAQLAKNDKPSYKWENVKTKLSDISTGDTHYVKPPETHIVVDFDIPDANGNKCLALNIEAAKKFPKTYAELSKSGQGIHLHYI